MAGPGALRNAASSEDGFAARYREPLVRYFLRRGLSVEAAEDCAQEAFARICQADGAQIEKIWDPFWQAEHPLIRRAGGSGLGLSIARRLAGLLGGDIHVASAPGDGSTFTVRLPLAH